MISRWLVLVLIFSLAAAAQESKPSPKSAYAVVAVALRDPGNADTVVFEKIAREVAQFHHAKLIEFDGRDFDGLERRLREAEPAHVAFVIRPETFDVNFHRHVTLLSARIDADPFCDFSFGYLTAKDGASLTKLWGRTVAVHKKGLATKTWIETAVAPKFDPIAIEGHIPEIAKAAGFVGATCFFAEKEWKNYSFEKVIEHLQRLKDAGVVSMSGNGDPQGIWLFHGDRNLDETRHWPFDRARVGQDPKGEMPRLKAAEFKKLALKGPVMWSGTCHSGATRRVYVEGDIVSTFGRSDTVVVYELKPDESLCLTWVDAGAVALLVPVASNHGMSCNLEQDFALSNGATLGETVKSTFDDVLLQTDGKPKVGMKSEGQPFNNLAEPPMPAGGLNRVLIGDPALRPFKRTKHPLETVTVTPITPHGVDVDVAWAKGFHAWGWDMYGGRSGKDWRIVARVSLDGLMPAKGPVPAVTATVEVKDPGGVVVPFMLTHAVVERHHGKLWLHLQANADRRVAQDRALSATFKARW